MRRFTLLILSLSLVLPALAQKPHKLENGKYIATPDMMNARAKLNPIRDQQTGFADNAMVQAKAVAGVQFAPTTGKAAIVSPTMIGRASNAFTIIRGEQNQVSVSQDLNMVSFIHRQDITIWGGGGTDNGRYRYDFSTDGGGTWTNDIGTLQNVYTNYGRYPNLAIHNQAPNTDPLQANIVWAGPTNRFPTPGWIGHVYGYSDVTTGTVTTTEHYLFDTENTLLPGSMVEGLPGEFWFVEFQYDGAAVMDSLRLMKGTYNSSTQDIDWVVHQKIHVDYDKSFDGNINAVGPAIAFSPDGMTGWIAILSNVIGGSNPSNETLLPVFLKSTDGGATWGSAMEANPNDVAWVADSLQSLWVDSLGQPASSGEVTTAFDYDITVDMNGNVHMGVVLGTSGGGFAISSGLAKFLADVYTPDGGATWDVTYMCPVLTFRGDFGQGSNPVSMDHFVQSSRTDDGAYIFHSWADNDTSTMFGLMSGVGFGSVDNIAPNLRYSAKRISDGFITYPEILKTDDDLVWAGRVLFPTMAPVSLTNAGNAHLPIVVLEMLANDALQPCQFWYFGNDATVDLSAGNFCDPDNMNLGWISLITGNTSCTVDIENPTNDEIVLHQSFPNPTSGEAIIRFEVPAVTNLTLDVVNLYGQTVATLAQGEYNAGMHEVNVNTSDYAAGVYFYNLRSNDQVITKKMTVTK